MMTFTYWRIVIFGTDSNMKSSKQENYNADFKIQDFIFTCWLLKFWQLNIIFVSKNCSGKNGLKVVCFSKFYV